MELWDMIALIIIVGIIGEVVKSVFKPRVIKKSELKEIRNAISNMQVS